MRRILAIVDEDMEYAEALASYLNGSGRCLFRAAAYPSPEAYRRDTADRDVRILLLSEQALAGLKPQELPPASVVLSEDGLVRSSCGLQAVLKYKNADRLLQDVLRFYSEDDMDRLNRAVSEKSRVIGIFSPAARCGRTSLAIALGMLFSGQDRTLLISLDGYAGPFRYIAAEAVSDLSDVIYGFRQGRGSWSLVAQSVYSFGGLDYIPPVRYYQDLLQMQPRSMAELLLRIADESGYEQILLDIGSYGSLAPETAELCDRIFMPVPEDEISRCKAEEFREAMERSGRKELLDRIITVQLPLEERTLQEMTRPETWLEGPLHETASRLAAEAGLCPEGQGRQYDG